ncbi:MAG TPA: SlyX family protein [Desulfuromonadaceae bacterium]
MNGRITELELRYMQQEKTIQELNETVCRQEQAIMRLERELLLLREQLTMLAPSAQGSVDMEEPPPPHY